MISNTYANKLLNLICGVSDAVSLPTILYLGMCSNEPDTQTGAVTGEPEIASYSRVKIGGTSATKYFGSASGGTITNNDEIKFDVIREAIGTMNYFFLSESATGNAILWGEITGGVTINSDTAPAVPVFYEGDIKISLDMPLS